MAVIESLLVMTLHTITYVLHKTNRRFSYLSLISYELSNVQDKHKEFKFFIFSSEVTDSYCTGKNLRAGNLKLRHL